MSLLRSLGSQEGNLIPTIVILFGAGLKLAGSLSLAVSLPTMLAGFTRYSRDQSFQVIRLQRRFIAIMAAGSIVGSYLGETSESSLPQYSCRFSQSYSLPRLSRCGGMRRSPTRRTS